MGLKTALYDTHVSRGAKIIDFGGWDMPLSFGSQLEEHHAVRRDAGMFDVSHMCIIDLMGVRGREFLRFLLANDVGKLRIPGQALYSCMLLPGGGVIDDLIAYFMTESWFRLVVNAGTRHKDLAWIGEHAAPFGVAVRERTDLAMIAVQGPHAIAKTVPLLSAAHRAAAMQIPRFSGATARLVVSGAHRIHRRGRLRDHAAGAGGRQDMGGTARAWHRSGRISAPAIRCDWKPA